MKITHNTVSLGETQSGKTYTMISLLNANKGTLRFYINTKLERKYNHSFRAFFSHADNIDTILFDANNGLNNHHIYCFNPDPIDKKFKELSKFLERIFLMKQSNAISVPVIVCVDEIRNFKRHSNVMEELIRIALQGNGMELYLCSIGQLLKHIPTDIRQNTDIFMINNSKNIQLEHMISEGLIEDIPDNYRKINPRTNEPYMYKFNMWRDKKDHTVYIQEPGHELRKLIK